MNVMMFHLLHASPVDRVNTEISGKELPISMQGDPMGDEHSQFIQVEWDVNHLESDHK